MIEPGAVVDRYTIEEILGQGGMAVVYRVRHNQLDSLHALKILTITNPGIKDRLLQEGRVQASLRHPNIVAVTDVLEINGAPGLVMEFIEGPGLDAWLHAHQPNVSEAVAIFEAICLGVAHAHDKGVIHRDLKPANVMMAPASGMWVPKVADFGLAKAVTEDGSMQKTRSGVTMGTPQYMAPEQIRDAKNVDERADVFSLGCILYELVCGRPPFTGPDILSIFNAVASGSFPAAVSLVPDLPPRVRDAIEGALVVDREARIGSVRQLIEILRGAPLPEITAHASMERGASPGSQTWAPDAQGIQVASAVSAGSNPSARAPSQPHTGTIDPGSAPSLGGSRSGGKRKMGMMVGGGLAVLAGLAGIAIVGLAGGALFASNRVETAVAEAIARTGDLHVSDVSLGPTGLVLSDFKVDGPDGDAVLTAKSVTFEASPAAFRGAKWTVDRIVVDGLEGELSRGADGRFHLASGLEGSLRDGAGFGVKSAAVVVNPGRVALASEGGTLDVEWDALGLSRLDLDLSGGFAWTAASGSLTGLDVGAADPLLRVGSAKVSDGKAELDGLELWIRGRTDGMLDLPPVFADQIADWAGGRRHKADQRDWLGIDLSGWPVAVDSVAASSGTLHLVERAHGVKTASADVALERFAVGPSKGERVPFGIAGSLGDARLSLDGDVAKDGLIRAEGVARYLPLDPLEPYLQPSYEHYGVAPNSGTLAIQVALTAQRNTLAAAVELTGEELAFEGAPGGARQRGKRLLLERDKVTADTVIEGNLADQRFSPFGEGVEAVRELLFAPAGGGVEDAAKAAERERIRKAKERELAAERAAAAAQAKAESPKPTAPAPATGGTAMSRGGTTTEEPAPTATDASEPSTTDEEEDKKKIKEDVEEAYQQFNRGVRDALDEIRIRKR